MSTKSVSDAVAGKYGLLTLFALGFLLIAEGTAAQKKNKGNKNTVASSASKYRNVFREAGYSQDSIDAKLAKAYHDVFEGQTKYILKWAIRWPMYRM